MLTESESDVTDSTDADTGDDDGRAGVWMPILGEDPGPVLLPVIGQGPKHAPAAEANPIDYVKLFLDDDLVTKIVEETNHYTENWISIQQDYLRTHPRSFVHKWIKHGKTNNAEMQMLFF
ncbi:PiggyBac transposable element-derived protein 4 [Plakobranchus ocellatus]|uniref:PiggyBac transposable element-derived protein 4 n=1 Tax=Plakobranchus ocellatus TaxID=259542 RepID=A0AAV4B031_9GAST|nr:PiggyBac transposable element-derived protein 4 [Plakobranchus ocellatus]